MSQPIACNLPSLEMRDRRAAWERLIERALVERHPIPDGMTLAFRDDDGVEAELRELARLERDCCSFAAWDVRRDGGLVRLDVTAPPDGIGVVRALFESRERGAAGP